MIAQSKQGYMNMYYTVKRIFSGVEKQTTLETLEGVKVLLKTPEICHDGMFIIVDWPVKWGHSTMIATDFKAPGESCTEFADRFEG